MTRPLLLLELNEVNFESVNFYCRRGELPNLGALIERNHWATTISERRYEELEPWIQWVTAHTGLTLAEHGIFRLGDIVKSDLPQIWERLEDLGLRVGAISPMNAKHRLRNPAFFVPDPWTTTEVTAGPLLRRLYTAIVQAVNDNAHSRLTVGSLFNLAMGLLFYARVSNYPLYGRLLASARSAPWRKAMLLDQLLADVFIREVKRTEPHFATLFLNAAAHIQHHYLFSAECYEGERRNPDWYVPAGVDPVREVYEIYDRIFGAVRAAFPEARIMIATGLHQDPHDEVTYYWRLRRHEKFLRRIGVPFLRVEPRMSRDFLVVCASEEQAKRAQDRLSQATAADGTPLFEVDNRGTDLFVMLTYPRSIDPGFVVRVGAQEYPEFDKEVAFVALKNGKHNGLGYFLDTETQFRNGETTMALKDLPDRIMAALGLQVGSRETESRTAGARSLARDYALG